MRHRRHVVYCTRAIATFDTSLDKVDRVFGVRLSCHGVYLSRQRESKGNRLEDLRNFLSGGVGAGAPRVSAQAPVPRESFARTPDVMGPN